MTVCPLWSRDVGVSSLYHLFLGSIGVGGEEVTTTGSDAVIIFS